MARHTKIIVRQINKVRVKPTYTLYQVIAVKPDGSPIVDTMGQELNLRTFEELPKNRVLDVSVETFNSTEYGVSYTLKALNYSLSDRVDELEQRMKAMEDMLASTPQPMRPPDLGGTPPPIPPVSAAGQDNDIPF